MYYASVPARVFAAPETCHGNKFQTHWHDWMNAFNVRDKAGATQRHAKIQSDGHGTPPKTPPLNIALAWQITEAYGLQNITAVLPHVKPTGILTRSRYVTWFTRHKLSNSCEILPERLAKLPHSWLSLPIEYCSLLVLLFTSPLLSSEARNARVVAGELLSQLWREDAPLLRISNVKFGGPPAPAIYVRSDLTGSQPRKASPHLSCASLATPQPSDQ
ncbi:hypothetical protein EDB86DRAFT_2828180 [Lactarius hatsudake]|nr:hypothetical protein EDB86DRAFT_2828180 [Lactarius hatsudake]